MPPFPLGARSPGTPVHRVTLSFDNGPDPLVTPSVLEVLSRYEVRAYFFLLGHKLAEPLGLALARRIRDAGHHLGNHSFSHTWPLGEDARPDAVEREIVATERLLDRVWNGPRLFRPFGGGKLGPHLFSESSLAYLRAHAYTCVLWNSLPEDWLDAKAWIRRALADCDANEHSLIVLHDVLREPMQRLEAFLEALAERGYELTDALPESCLPIVEGEARLDLRPFVSLPRAAGL